MQPARLPWWMRALDGAHASVQSAGLQVVSLDPETMIRAAAKRVGAPPIEDPRLRQRLGRLCRSIEQDANLNLFGRISMRRHLVDALVTRMRVDQLERERPDVFDTKLRDPVIVVGLPRSGTTFLHRLLHADPVARAFPIWELRQPIPGPGPDRRRETFVEELKQVKRLIPDIDIKHRIDVDEPEECMFFCDPSLISLSFWVDATCFDYLENFASRDHTDAYQTYRKILQYFQSEQPSRRLTLKAPAHTGNVEALKRAVPEAHLVQTHRDPVKVAPSMCSLLLSVQEMQAQQLDRRRTVETNLRILEYSVNRNHEQRARLNEPIFDIDYAELVADPFAAVRSIYEHFDLPWSSTVEEHLRAHIDDRPQHKYGKHEYSPADYGWTEDQLARRFSDYRERWGFA
jgi:hypothetical protein